MSGRVVPIAIPPGAVRHGTEYQSKGRWRDVNCVRWRDGVLTKIGGWSSVANQADAPYGVRGMMTWTDDSANTWTVMGTYAGCWVADDSWSITDLTPGGFTSGSLDGSGFSSPATTWSWATFGEVPIGCSSSDGKLYEWDLNTGNNLTAVTNAPTGNRGVAVSAERFVFALGAGGDPRKVEWSDRGDRTVWTAAATNQAGGFTLDTEGEIQFAAQVRGEMVIVTTNDIWSARYIGYPDVYDIRKVGDVTCVGKRAGVAVDDRLYLWGGVRDNFYVYSGGYVRVLPCPVFDHLKRRVSNDTKTYAWHNRQRGEVWWFYEANDSTNGDVQHYVAYDYNEDVWSYGVAPFSAAADYSLPLTASIAALSYDSDVITNGAFTSDTSWTKGTNWQITSGTASQTSPTASTLSQSVSGIVSTATWYVQFTVSGWSAGQLVFNLVDGNSATATTGPTSITGNGTYEAYLVPTTAFLDGYETSATFQIVADGTFDGAIDDVSLNRTTLYYIESLTGVVDTLPYAKSGPIEVGAGENRAHVTRLFPDEVDDFTYNADTTYTFTSREYPTGTETTHGPYTSSLPTDVRFSGRWFTIKVQPDYGNSVLDEWRGGLPRLEITTGGRR